MRGWSCSIEGHADPSDPGQGLIEDAWAGGTLLNDVKIHISAASYWIPDVTTDSSAGGRVTSYALNQAHDAVAGISLTLAGSGPITFV